MNRHLFFLLVGYRPHAERLHPGPRIHKAGSPGPCRLADRCGLPRKPELTPGAPTATELRWQEFFTDERLQQIIETALNNNRDLRLAALNVERARALYGIQRAELLPSVNAVGSGSQDSGCRLIFRATEDAPTDRTIRVSISVSLPGKSTSSAASAA